MAQLTDGVDDAARVVTQPTASARPPVAPGSPIVAVLKRVCAWAPAFAAVALLAGAVLGEMPVLSVVRATAAVILTQVLPGALVWRAVRPRRGWLAEDLAMGFAVGSALAIGVQIVAGLAQQPWISYTPLLLGAVLVAIPATRARIRGARTTALPWWWGPPVAALMLMTCGQLLNFFRAEPLTWTSGARTPYVDAYLHLALAAQLEHRGPTTFPWVSSEALGYHWFSHAWIAQVSATSGAGLDEVLFRFKPVLMPVVVVLAIAVAGVRLTGLAWAGPAAAALSMVGGDLNVFGRLGIGLPINPLSPSLALSIPMMVAMVVVLALRWQRRMLSGAVIVLILLSLGSAGTKGSTLPLVLAGLGLAAAACLFFNRSRFWAVVLDGVLVTATLVFAFVVVFRGSGAGLHLSVEDAAGQTPAASWLGAPGSSWQMAFVIGLAVIGVLARGVAAYALPFSREGRRDPLAWLLIGGGLASAGAVALFAHPGVSQWYFVQTAEPLLALGSVLGLVALFKTVPAELTRRIVAVGAVAGLVLVTAGPLLFGPLTKGSYRRAAAMLLLAGLILLAAAAVGWFMGGDRRQRTRLAATVVVVAILAGGTALAARSVFQPLRPPLKTVTLDRPWASSQDQIAAARWIRDHSDVDDLVMTNRHCTIPVEPVGCDSRRFLVTAFSERQVLLEGWTATPMSAKLGPNGRDSITVSYWKPELLQLNDGFIAAPSEEGARRLRDLGVRWIYVDHTRPYAPTLEPYAKLRFQTADADVYEFTTS
ncbi:MAG: hypothetical protein HOV79_11865 [Hamadaea sp.]|nr:hypothetical protein [Hamadaea sp.]